MQRFLLTMGLALALFLTVQALSPAVGIVVDESLVQPPWSTSDTVFIIPEHHFPIWFSSPSVFFAQKMYVLYGSFFLGVWLWRERRLSQSYYLVLGALLLSLSAIGALMGFFLGKDEGIALLVNYLRPLAIHLWAALLFCGSSMVLAGLLDHRQLVRALRPAVSRKEVER